MIRINRLIKKDSLYKILELPHVSKIELLQGKINQKDPNVVRIYIYLIDILIVIFLLFSVNKNSVVAFVYLFIIIRQTADENI